MRQSMFLDKRVTATTAVRSLAILFHFGDETEARTYSCLATKFGQATKIIYIFVFTMLFVVPQVNASRLFTFSNDSTIESEGELEVEQWVTWKTNKDNDPDFDEHFFNLEFEYGLYERLQLSLYVDWRYQDGASVEDDGVEFRDVALEGIYQLSHPETGLFGAALLGEFKIGDELLAVEAKLILQKNFGNTILVWNGIVEAEWEEDRYTDDKGEFKETLGLSHEVTLSSRVGIELLHELDYADWAEWEEHVVYIGPNISWERGEFWLTVTPSIQITDVDSEADFLTRAVVGIEF